MAPSATRWLVPFVGLFVLLIPAGCSGSRHRPGRPLSAPVLYMTRASTGGNDVTRLWRADALDAAPLQVAELLARYGSNLSVSPDGRTAMFFSDMGKKVNLVALADGRNRQVSSPPHTSFWLWNGWAPSGTSIACLFTPDRYDRLPIESSLAFFTADSLKRTATLGPIRGMGDVSFLPDGRSFVFASVEGIETMRTDGTGRQVLVPRSPGEGGQGVVASVTLSPNGRELAFLRADSAEASGLYLLDLSDKSERYAGGGGPSFGTPCWSPEGRRIALSATDRSDVSQLVIVDVQGGNRRFLTKGPRSLLPLSWSPSGEEILALTYVPGHASGNDLVVVEVASGEEHTLATGVHDAVWIHVPSSGS